MQETRDGPVSPHFQPIKLAGTIEIEDLQDMGVSAPLAENLHHSPSGPCTSWGLPFEIEDPVVVNAVLTSVSFTPTTAQWFVIMHTSDIRPLDAEPDGFISPMRGAGRLNEHAATYVLLYEDGTEARAEIRRRHQVGAFQRGWGENCFQAVTHIKPAPVRASHEQLRQGWGKTQTRADNPDGGLWMNWLWAWENPQPGKSGGGHPVRAGQRHAAGLRPGRGERRREPAPLATADQSAAHLAGGRDLGPGIGRARAARPDPA